MNAYLTNSEKEIKMTDIKSDVMELITRNVRDILTIEASVMVPELLSSKDVFFELSGNDIATDTANHTPEKITEHVDLVVDFIEKEKGKNAVIMHVAYVAIAKITNDGYYEDNFVESISEYANTLYQAFYEKMLRKYNGFNEVLNRV